MYTDVPCLQFKKKMTHSAISIFLCGACNVPHRAISIEHCKIPETSGMTRLALPAAGMQKRTRQN